MLAGLEGVRARCQKCLPQVTATQHLALAQDSESEMAAGRTAFVPSEGLKVALVQKTPLLQRTPPLQYVCTTAGQRGLATGAGESVVTPTSTAALSVPRSAQAAKNPALRRG